MQGVFLNVVCGLPLSGHFISAEGFKWKLTCLYVAPSGAAMMSELLSAKCVWLYLETTNTLVETCILHVIQSVTGCW